MRTALTVRDSEGNTKEYQATEDDISMGLCEDVLNAFRADLLVGGFDGPDSAEIQNAVSKAMMSSLSGFYPFAARLFDGLTEDEWRSAKVTDCVAVMRDVLTYGLNLLGSMLSDGSKTRKPKNRRGTPSPSIKHFSTSRSPSAIDFRR